MSTSIRASRRTGGDRLGQLLVVLDQQQLASSGPEYSSPVSARYRAARRRSKPARGHKRPHTNRRRRDGSHRVERARAADAGDRHGGTSVAIAGCGSNAATATQSAKEFASHALAKQVAFVGFHAPDGGPGLPGPDAQALCRSALASTKEASAAVGGTTAFTRPSVRAPKSMPPGDAGTGATSPTAPGARRDAEVRHTRTRRRRGDDADPAANGVFHLPPGIDLNAPAFQSAIKR